MDWKKSAFILFLSVFGFNAVAEESASKKVPIVIGHRGASGYRPEHTLASYQLAIEMGADYVEPDLVMTKDKVLVARHENEISGTTDVATKFPDRKTTKTVDGEKITGWFIEDFTLVELKTLKSRERRDFRDQSYNGKFDVPTFSEILKLVKEQSKIHKRDIGIYPEVKHPTYFTNTGLPLEQAMVQELEKAGLNNKNSKVYIQSFELGALKKLKALTPIPLVFLVGGPKEIPYDHIFSGDKRNYKDLMAPESLKELSLIISGIGPDKRWIVPTGLFGGLQSPTSLIAYAHAAGLVVHPYTFRNEKQFLHSDYENDPIKEYIQFYKLGVDGVFSDFSDVAVKARTEFLKQ